MQRGRGGRAAGQHEARQLRQVVVEAVAELLERVDRRLLDPQPTLDPDRDAEIGADVEQLVLDPRERLDERGRAVAGEDDAEQAFSSSTSP